MVRPSPNHVLPESSMDQQHYIISELYSTKSRLPTPLNKKRGGRFIVLEKFSIYGILFALNIQPRATAL
jgi:hypothetical protein